MVAQSGSRVVPAQRRRSLAQRIWASRRLYLYLTPGFILLLIFNYYPPLSAIYHSFFQWDGISPPIFNGLNNFQQMLTDDDLVYSVGNLLKLLAFQMVIGVAVPVIVAELIFNLKSKGLSYFWRMAFIVPVVLPGIVGILLWQFIYDPNVGLLNSVLQWMGHAEWGHAWLGDYHTALYAVMFFGFPFVGGTSVLIALAGLQSISQEVIEASRLDGCTGLRRVWSIDIPHIMGQIKFFWVLGIIGGIQQFSLQLVLTQGGPGRATLVPGLYMYNTAFRDDQFGYGSAIGLVMFVVILILTYINFKYIRSEFEYEGRSA